MKEILLIPALQKNDARARLIIISISVIVFIVVVILGKVKLDVILPFDVHIFALVNAVINSFVGLLLVSGLIYVRKGKYLAHKRLMIAAIILSVFFLVSYIAHHLFAGDTKFGDLNHDGLLSADEKIATGNWRWIYYILLLTHIPLAAIILPFILFTAYRSLTGEYEKHKKLARITWPVWFYVALSGVLVFLMIRPYYY